jgi:hypothetical protein
MTYRRKAARATIGLGLTLALFGCSLIVSTSDLSTDAEDLGPDAEGDRIDTIPDGGGADGSDGASSDAPVTVDAASRFCAQQTPTPTFCEDFDDDADFARWKPKPENVDGGAIGLDTMLFESGPRSLRAALPVVGGNLERVLVGPVLAASPTVHVEASINVSAGSTYVAPFYVVFEDPDYYGELTVTVRDTNIRIIEYWSPCGAPNTTCGNQHGQRSGAFNNRWVKVGLDVTFAPDWKVAFTVDGVSAGTFNLKVQPPPLPVRANAGLWAIEPQDAPTRGNVDDIVIRLGN